MEYEILTCDICGFDAKGKVGLRMHKRKHENEAKQTQAEEPEEDVQDEVIEELKKEEEEEAIEIIEKVEEVMTDKVIRTATVVLHEGDKWIAEYIVSGQAEIDKAKAHAKNMGYTIKINDLVKVHI